MASASVAGFAQIRKLWRRKKQELRFASIRCFGSDNGFYEQQRESQLVGCSGSRAGCFLTQRRRHACYRPDSTSIRSYSARSGQQCAAFAISAKTIYFGGGTPTALTTLQLEFLLGGFHQRLDLSALEEWTIEANPGSVSARKAALLRKLKVNRISLGVQSWDDRLLNILGREHNASQAERSFHTLRDAEFRNINIDIMFGLPGQSTEQWKATLEKTITLQPEHISAYCLTYEEDTEFFLRQSRGELKANPDGDAGL